MQRPVTAQSRGPNANEKARMQWLKDRGQCSACGNQAPVINHHCAGSAAKIKYQGVTVLIGHAFVIGLCQPCDDIVTRGSRRRLVDVFGPQSVLWLLQEASNPNPAPREIILAVSAWGDKYEPKQQGDSSNG